MDAKERKMVNALISLSEKIGDRLDKQELALKEANFVKNGLTGDQEASMIIKRLREYFDKYSYLNVDAEINTDGIKTWDDFLNKLHNHIIY